MLLTIRQFLLLALAALVSLTPARAAQRGPLVLAAASLQEALGDAAKAWAGRRNPAPVLSFAASSALARQIESPGLHGYRFGGKRFDCGSKQGFLTANIYFGLR